MNTGVMGGTFDPIHNGHLGIAEAAIKKLGLEKVLFVPARRPWLKEFRIVAPEHHRLEMVRLAVSPFPYFEVSDVDMNRPGPSYTVDTLADLGSELGEGASLYFIIGADAIAGLPEWREPERIIRMCHLAVASRPGVRELDIDGLEHRLPGISDRIITIDSDLYDVNSTGIRDRIAAGVSIEGLVPAAVADYIDDHGLYGKEV